MAGYFVFKIVSNIDSYVYNFEKIFILLLFNDVRSICNVCIVIPKVRIFAY